jgi:hypothetical protein
MQRPKKAALVHRQKRFAAKFKHLKFEIVSRKLLKFAKQ